MPRPINRRAFLRGLGGAAVALPMLEIMLEGPARAADAPRRFLVCFGGQSLGADRDPLHNDYVPNKIGADYDLKSALAPLAGVKAEISVVSGLDIPAARGGPIPAGGRADDFHINSLSPLLSGVRSGPRTVNGPTSDQIVAAALGGKTTFKSLLYRVQAAWYLSVSAPYGRDVMSYRAGQSGAPPEPIPPTVSPKAAFDALFFGFMPPTDQKAAAEQERRWRQRRSVLDLVRGNAARLVERVGGADRRRIEQHLDELRDLERRVSAVPPMATAQCHKPPIGADPPIGGNQGNVNGANTFDVNLGYSGEEERARAFCDLLHMAFTCDLTRVGSLMFTMAQSHMNMFPLTQQGCDLHEISHNGIQGGTLAVSQAIAWHMRHFAYLIARLRDTRDATGQSLLDSSAVVFLHEGGHGLDSGTGNENSAHSTQNMACLIAGRAGGLRPGQHVVAAGRHPAHVLVTAMNAVGVPTAALGEVSGTIPGI